ncbi:hypothetical protein SAMN05518856_10149 [Paenibacillus sp. OK003]|nr:hypothetical protein SAMN05518856_10149 [Paenibacillus sp. OK003]
MAGKFPFYTFASTIRQQYFGEKEDGLFFKLNPIVVR